MSENYVIVNAAGEYLMPYADRTFGSVGYQWTTDPTLAWKFPDKASAEDVASKLNATNVANRRVRVVKL